MPGAPPLPRSSWRSGACTAFGVGDAELAREIVEMRAALKNAVVGAETRNTPTVASDLVELVDARDVFTDPAADLAIRGRREGPDHRRSRRRRAADLQGQGPVLSSWRRRPRSRVVTRPAAEFARLQSAPVDAETAQASVAWPYTSFGPPGAVLKRTEMPEFGAVAVRFANGVGLIVKPTKFEQGQILVTARIDGGRLSLSRRTPARSGQRAPSSPSFSRSRWGRRQGPCRTNALSLR